MKILGRVLHNKTYDKNQAPFLVEVHEHEMRLLLLDTQYRSVVVDELMPGTEVQLHAAWQFYNDLVLTVKGLGNVPENLRKIADTLQRNVDLVQVPEKPKTESA